MKEQGATMKTFIYKEDGAYTSQGWLTIHWILTFEDDVLVFAKPFLSKSDAMDYQEVKELAENLKEFA
jgi:hypothetical protein